MATSVGIDVGFGNTKSKSDYCQLDFTSVIGEFSPVKFSSGMETAADPTLSMVLEYQGKRSFVGPSALRQTVAQNTIEHTRTVEDEGKLLLLAALGLSMGNDVQANLVVGLPVMHYSDLKDRYTAQCSGTHVFNYLTLTGDVKDRKAITVRNVKVLPQPFGTIFDMLLNEDGTFRDRRLASGKIGVVDIGYNTVDLLRADALQYINRRSTSFSELGMFSAYRELSTILYHQFKVEIPPEKLEPIVQKGVLSIAGRNHPIETYKQEAFRVAADNIISRVRSVWPDSWELDTIVFAGGGAVNLGAYLTPAFAQAKVAENPLFSNVNGYHKCAKFTWRT